MVDENIKVEGYSKRKKKNNLRRISHIQKDTRNNS